MRNLTAAQRYWQAVRKARIQNRRNVYAMLEGRAMTSGPPGTDLERDAIIAEIDRLIRAKCAAESRAAIIPAETDGA